MLRHRRPSARRPSAPWLLGGRSWPWRKVRGPVGGLLQETQPLAISGGLARPLRALPRQHLGLDPHPAAPNARRLRVEASPLPPPRRATPASPPSSPSLPSWLSPAAAATARIVVQGRNIEATPAIKSYCEDKVGNAIKHFDGVKEVRSVEVGVSLFH